MKKTKLITLTHWAIQPIVKETKENMSKGTRLKKKNRFEMEMLVAVHLNNNHPKRNI